MPNGRKRTRGAPRGRPKRQRVQDRDQGEVEPLQLSGDDGGSNPDQRSEEHPRQGNPNTQGPTSAFRHLIDFEKLLQSSGIGPLVSGQNTSARDLPTQPPIQSSGLESTPPLETEPGANFTFGLDPVRLGSDDLSAHVPASICQKIQSLQYININLLLKGAVELQEICSGGAVHLNKQGVLESRPKIVKEQVSSIEKWTDAFLIFSSIFLKKHPSKAQELLQYMSIIREAANRSPSSFAWRQYDEHFRLRQATQAQPWNKINADLWLRVMTMSTHTPVPSDARPTSKIKCLDFNHGVCRFKPCRYLHACSHCDGTSHGRHNCFKLNPSRADKTFLSGRGSNSNNRGGKTSFPRGPRQ